MQLAAYGKVDGCGEQAMKSEILQRGPITCSIASDDSFVYTYRHGVYKGPNATEVDHDIEVPPPASLRACHRTANPCSCIASLYANGKLQSKCATECDRHSREVSRRTSHMEDAVL